LGSSLARARVRKRVEYTNSAASRIPSICREDRISAPHALEHMLRVYRQHYNEHGPHRALRLMPPHGRDPTPLEATARLRRRDLLGGLIQEYEAA
jgi:hypothetical protein